MYTICTHTRIRWIPLAINQTFNKSRATKKRVHYFDCRSGQAQKWKHAASVVHKLAQRNHTHTHTGDKITRIRKFRDMKITQIQQQSMIFGSCSDFLFGGSGERPDQTKLAHFAGCFHSPLGFGILSKWCLRGKRRERELNNFENVACWRLFPLVHISVSFTWQAGRMRDLKYPFFSRFLRPALRPTNAMVRN